MSTTKEIKAAIILGLSGLILATPTPNLTPGSLIAHAGTQQCYYPPNAVCSEYTIPLTITSEETVFNFTEWDNNYALQEFLALATTRVGVEYPGIVEGTRNVTRDVEIAASFCAPRVKSGKEGKVILATHGIGPGREHWK